MFLVNRKHFDINGNGTKFMVSRELLQIYSPEPPTKEYTELEYIKFNNSIIDTGINPDNAYTKIKLKFSCYGFNNNDQDYIIGNSENSNNPWFSMEVERFNHLFQSNLGSSPYIMWDESQSAVLGQIYQFDATYQNNQVIFEGTYSRTVSYSGSITKNYSIQISPLWNGGQSKIQLYSCKVSTKNESVDLIPVKDKDGVVCMYDKVSETYFYNQGTGEFTPGPEVH